MWILRINPIHMSDLKSKKTLSCFDYLWIFRLLKFPVWTSQISQLTSPSLLHAFPLHDFCNNWNILSPNHIFHLFPSCLYFICAFRSLFHPVLQSQLGQEYFVLSLSASLESPLQLSSSLWQNLHRHQYLAHQKLPHQFPQKPSGDLSPGHRLSQAMKELWNLKSEKWFQ